MPRKSSAETAEPKPQWTEIIDARVVELMKNGSRTTAEVVAILKQEFPVEMKHLYPNQMSARQYHLTDKRKKLGLPPLRAAKTDQHWQKKKHDQNPNAEEGGRLYTYFELMSDIDQIEKRRHLHTRADKLRRVLGQFLLASTVRVLDDRDPENGCAWQTGNHERCGDEKAVGRQCCPVHTLLSYGPAGYETLLAKRGGKTAKESNMDKPTLEEELKAQFVRLRLRRLGVKRPDTRGRRPMSGRRTLQKVL